MSTQHAYLLPRKHITRALVEAVSEYPLTVLTAPLGYGKSTAARSLLAEFSSRTDWRLFTQTMTTCPNSAASVWICLGDQLDAQGSEVGSFMRRLDFPLDEESLQRLMRFCRERLMHADDLARRQGIVPQSPPRQPRGLFAAAMPPPLMRTLLVLDDWQCADSPDFDRILEAAAREELPGLSLLVLSRERPGLRLEELRLKNLAVILDHSLLAFSEDETVALFRLHGLDNAKGRKAWERSEGWPAAIRLHLRESAAGTSAGPSSEVDALLAQAAFEPHSGAEQELLLRLSVLESFTVEQAAHLTGDPCVPTLLGAIYSRNTFLSRAPDGTYRLHSLLRSFLNRRLCLARESAGHGIDPASLLRRAGELYLAEGDTARAIRAFASAGRTEDLERILEISAFLTDTCSLMLDPSGIAGLVLSLPWSVRRTHPLAYLAFVLDYINWMDEDKGALLLDEAEEQFVRAGDFEPALTARLAGEIALIRGFLHRGDMRHRVELHNQAKDLLQGPSSIIRPGRATLCGSPHAGLILHRTSGEYESVTTLYERWLQDFVEVSDGCGAGTDLLVRAERLLETGCFDAVNSLALQADHEARLKRQLSVRLAVALVRARLALSTGSNDNPMAYFSALEPEVRASGHPLHRVSLDLAVGYVLTSLGKIRGVAAWLREGDLDPCRLLSQGVGMAYIVHGKYLLTQGRHQQLADFCGLMLRQFTRNRSIFGLIHAYSQLAIATLYLQGPDEALPHLKAAAELARPDGVMLPIAGYGYHLRPALEKLYETGGRRKRAWLDALTTLAARLERQCIIYGDRRGRTQPRSDSAQNAIDSLHPKSRQVLHLIAQGKNNAEIARTLGVKPVTVAKILGGVYRTLHVRNRAEAMCVWSRYEEESLEAG